MFYCSGTGASCSPASVLAVYVAVFVCLFVCLQSQFLLSLQAISIMVHFYMGTKGPENVSTHAQAFRDDRCSEINSVGILEIFYVVVAPCQEPERNSITFYTVPPQEPKKGFHFQTLF